MKYKEKYKAGMIFRSKKYPWADIIIDYVSYMRSADNAYEFNLFSIIDWTRANPVEFDKFVCKRKGYNYMPDENGHMDFSDKTTFPYPFFGEMQPKSMDSYLRKYELEYIGMSDKKVKVYKDDESEYSSGFLED